MIDDPLHARHVRQLYALLLHTEQWAHRRVEQIEFVDEDTIRRQVSIDLTVPVLAGAQAGEPVLVPLTLLRKRPLAVFDLRDEDGRALPMLTRAQNQRLATGVLSLAVEIALGQPAPDELVERLAKLTGAPPEAAEAELEGILNHPHLHDVADRRLRRLAADLAHANLLLVALPAGQRRIVKFAYQEEIVEGVSGDARTVSAQLGWQATPFTLPVPALGDTESYHLSVLAPDGLMIARSQLLDLHDGRPLGAAQSAVQRAAHRAAGLGRETQAALRVELRSRHGGLLGASMLATLACALLVSVGALMLRQLLDHTESSAALLLLAPGVVSAYLVRPEEHRLLSRMLRGSRQLVVLSGLCSFLSALSLIAGLPERALFWTWFVSSLLAWLAALGVWLAWRRSRAAARPPKRSSQPAGAPQSAPETDVTPTPESLRQAARVYGFDLHGWYAESAEAFRAGGGGLAAPADLGTTLKKLGEQRA